MTVMNAENFQEPVVVNGRSSKMGDVEIEEGSTKKTPKSETAFILIFLLSNCVQGMFFSFHAGFFPVQVQTYGLTEKDVGIILAGFPFSSLILIPFSSYLIRKFSIKNIYIYSYVLATLVLIPFAFVEKISSATTFYVACLILRMVQGVAFSGILVACFCIIGVHFQNRLSTLSAAISFVIGFGASLGPLYSGVVYDHLGFESPFLILAALHFIVVLLLFTQRNNKFLDCEQKNTDNEPRTFSLKELWTMPDFYIALSGCGLVFLVITFLELSIANYVHKMFGANSTIGGTYAMLSALSYSIAAVPIGYLMDRKGHVEKFNLLGVVLVSVTFLFIGPAPFLNIKSSYALLAVALIIYGPGGSTIMIASQRFSYKVLEARGYPCDLASTNLVSSTAVFTRSVGMLIGPFFGGFSIDYLGFGWSCTAISVITALWGLLSLYPASKLWSSSSKRSSDLK